MRFSVLFGAVMIFVTGHANAAVFSETVTTLPETGEFQSYFDFMPFDSSLGTPTSVQVSFSGHVEPKVTNTGLTADSMVTIQPMMSVEFYGAILEPTFDGDPLTIPVDLAGAGIVGGQGFSASYNLPLSFLQTPGGVLSGFTMVSLYSTPQMYVDLGSMIDESSYGGHFTLNVTYDAADPPDPVGIAEPASLCLFGTGLLGLTLLRMNPARAKRLGRKMM